MSYMFCDAHAFNGDLSRWDTSNVTTMRTMFYQAHAFNGDLSRWDTSNVTTMRSMFCYATVFNGDLSRWDTSKVTTMADMFYECPIEAGGNVKQGQKRERMFEKYIFNLAFSFNSLAVTYHKFVH
jgi:surface protein